MVVNYQMDMDLANPGPINRIHVKQGDAMSRSVYISLLENGESWSMDRSTQALIRYCVQDPGGMVIGHGLYDTTEDGSPAYSLAGNILALSVTGAMTAQPGLVTVDVVLTDGVKQLTTFNFEIYVNRSVNDGTVAQSGNYYRVATLDAINRELDALRSAITAMGGEQYLT